MQEGIDNIHRMIALCESGMPRRQVSKLFGWSEANCAHKVRRFLCSLRKLGIENVPGFVAIVEKGTSHEDISAILGWNRVGRVTTFVSDLRAIGIPIGKLRLQRQRYMQYRLEESDRYDQALDLWDVGLTQTQIAAQLNIHPRTLTTWLGRARRAGDTRAHTRNVRQNSDQERPPSEYRMDKNFQKIMRKALESGGETLAGMNNNATPEQLRAEEKGATDRKVYAPRPIYSEYSSPLGAA